jgi:Kef-type K+ transport system membrane component KefB
MRSIVIYVLLVGVPVLLILQVLDVGRDLQPAASTVTQVAPSREDPTPITPLHVPTLLAQIGIVLISARLVGLLFRKIHQPQVMGEMVAGILLGPSLLGSIFPSFSAVLFPANSLGFLNSLSQVGLLFYMFVVGLELNLHTLRRDRDVALITSHVSIIFPFLLGALLALFLYPRLSDHDVSFVKFALFLGTAMSVTAFPVLARILSESGLVKTRVGAVAIACAAVDDVTAWCILAGVVLLVRTDPVTSPLTTTLIGLVVYVSIMVFAIRPILRKLETAYERRGSFTHDMLGIIMLVPLASAFTTELLGFHAVFGAFLAGVMMPKKNEFVDRLKAKLEDFIVVLLLPLFFAFTGLRTSIGLVSGGQMWFYCGLLIAVAIAGKFGGSTISARLTGMPWREAGALGVLMNTRGLMELVVLNIGLDIGAISQTVFTMMVLMALVTTLMTSPLLEWVYPRHHRVQEPERIPQQIA